MLQKIRRFVRVYWLDMTLVGLVAFIIVRMA